LPLESQSEQPDAFPFELQQLLPVHVPLEQVAADAQEDPSDFFFKHLLELK
jgi:hypothetical protein